MKRFYLFIPVIIVLMITGCTKRTETSYMNEAAKAISDNKMTEAIASYDNLVNDFPTSPKAPFALFQTATFYQNGLVKQENLTNVQSFEKAVERFRSIFDKYPNDKLAPKALFMSGFIQANDLKQYPQATATFNLFLQKYPDNELANSVKRN